MSLSDLMKCSTNRLKSKYPDDPEIDHLNDLIDEQANVEDIVEDAVEDSIEELQENAEEESVHVEPVEPIEHIAEEPVITPEPEPVVEIEAEDIAPKVEHKPSNSHALFRRRWG